MTTLRIDKYQMPSASLGEDNPLPDLQKNMDAHAAIAVDDTSISKEESKYMGWGRVNGILPYTIHNNYNRKKKMHEWKSIVLENDFLKATFLPNLGARLWSLIDKQTGRELLHCNPVFQPCNLALRNAWISGGVEWNLGIIGHTPFTVDSLYAETFELSDGTPVVRFYQYERVRNLVYRVEAMLPEGSRHLLVRVRIDNAGDKDTAVYWWSNMAVNEGEDIRVLVPADRAYRFGYGGKIAKLDIPYMNGWDISHTMQIPQAMDFFFDIEKHQRRWIAALDKDGYGLCQTSTERLVGRKLFVWGMGAGGRHWQEFLAQPGCKYIEIQAGIAHTQLEHLPMAGKESISWMEAYGAIHANGQTVQGQDWKAARNCVDAALEEIYPNQMMNDDYAWLTDQIDKKHGKLVHTADGWAALQEELLGDKFRACGLKFPKARMGEAEKQWEALLVDGALPCPDPLEAPKGYQISDEWLKLLKKSISSGKGNHWYSQYQLGVMMAYRNETAAARKAFEKSLKLARSPWALRCLAVLDKQDGDKAKAAERMLAAVEMTKQRNVAIEALEALNAAERYSDTVAVIQTLPAAVKGLGRVKVLEIKALLELGELAKAEKLMLGEIELTDVREGEIALTDMWFRLCALKRVKEDGVELTDELMEKVKAECVPPKHLDFRMH